MRYEPRLPNQSDPPITLPDLEPGHHLCCLYETEEEHKALLTPFLCQGLERGEKVIYAVHAHTVESVLGYLQEDGLDVGPYLARGQLSIVAAESIYLRERVFNPEEMISLLRTETERALAEGYVGLRATAEMTWALENPPGSHRLIEYEAKVNAFFRGCKCTALCQYDRARFSPVVILNVLYSHPVVVVGAKTYDNFYYIPPEDFLGDDVPAAVLRNCMKNLAARKGLETELRDAREQLRTAIQERILERRKANEALPPASPGEKRG
jgi:KaiC/GvpD/RAD55 family RecA-like ATPase